MTDKATCIPSIPTHVEEVEDPQEVVPAQAAEVCRHVDQGRPAVDVFVLIGVKQLRAGGDKLLHGNSRLVHPARTTTEQQPDDEGWMRVLWYLNTG